MGSRYTKIALAFVCVVYIFSLFYYSKWERHQTLVGGGDSFGYYVYLPSIFIYNDLNHLRNTIYARNVEAEIHADSTKPIENVGEVYFFKTGTPVIKYTCGIAILESPAFFTAHLIARLFKLPATGFSSVYIISIFIWTLLFGILGLLLLSKVLAHYFSDIVIALTILSIGLATNLYHFSVYLTGMSHVYLFTLYATLLYATIRYHRTFSMRDATVLGLSAGMITLIRPNEVICILIPLLYNISSIQSLVVKVQKLLTQKSLYVAMLCFALCVLPQLAYWLYATGHLVYYSYGAETFNFKDPHILGGLFGYQNGWLPFAPIMILALIGLLPMAFSRKEFLLPVLTVLPIHIYVIYSWWCWRYVNGIGSRPMIEMSAILAIPLACFIHMIWKNIWLKISFIVALILLTVHQLSLTWRFNENILWTEICNRTFYWNTMFAGKLTYQNLVELDTDEDQPRNIKLKQKICFVAHNDSTDNRYSAVGCNNNNYSLIIDNTPEFYPLFETSLDSFQIKPGDWLKVSLDNCNLYPYANIYEYVALNTAFLSGNQQLKCVHIKIQNKLPGDGIYKVYRFDTPASGKVYYFTQVPAEAKGTDKVSVFAYNTSNSRVAINNLSVEVWR